MNGSLVSLIVFLFPLAYSPGPGNMFFAANGARFGFRSTIPANLGYHIATFVVTAVIGLGLESGLEDHSTAFSVLKTAGSLYVLWIAWKLFRSGAVNSDEQPAQAATARDGAVLLLLNPKAYVIIAVMFTQFLESDNNSRFIGVLIITTIFTINNIVAFAAWTLLGDKLTTAFRSQGRARKLNIALSGTLAAVAIWILLS